MVYPGSKNRLSPYFVPLLQKIIDEHNITTYIEPFVGGANIFDKIKCENKFAYDKSKTLIALFNQGLSDSSVIPAHGSREWWDEAKAQYKGEKPRTMPDWKIGAIQFFASFGTRGFPGGYANNKNGKDYYNERYRNFIEQLDMLRLTGGGIFDCKNYKDIEILDGSLIYCDPPYEGTKPYGYSFENKFDHQEYWSWVRKISKKNYVVCSEQTAPDDFITIWSGKLNRLVASKNDYVGEEKLFIYESGLLKDSFN